MDETNYSYNQPYIEQIWPRTAQTLVKLTMYWPNTADNIQTWPAEDTQWLETAKYRQNQ